MEHRTGQHYVYETLRNNRIRLLWLNPDSQPADVGCFEEFDLDGTPAYYTLSYTWGSELQNHSIKVKGHTIHVSRHLATGLRHLQKLADVDSPLAPSLRYVWIDYMCIDQSNPSERASQVRMIGMIYSRAVRTLIWLGPEFENCTLAWQLVDGIYSLPENQCSNGIPGEIGLQTFSQTYHSNTGLPELAEKQWEALRDLFDLQWFSRIWVVQEVVLSPMDPLLIQGNHLHHWYQVERIALWLRRKGYLRLSQLSEGLLYVDSIGYLRRSKADWPLSALMSITQKKFHAKDQRDKIYGLLGLAAETLDASSVPAALIPDYTIDVRTAYTNVTRFFLERVGSLAILTRIRGTEGSISRKRRQHDFEEWPSWLPDWSDFAVHDRELRKSFSWIHYGDITRPARLGFPKQYRAAGDLPLRMHLTPDVTVLRVEGLKADMVKEVIQMSDSTIFVDEFKSTFDSTMIRVSPLIATFDAWVNQLIEATTANQQPLIGRTWKQGLKDGYAYLHTLLTNEPSLLSLSALQDGTQAESLQWFHQAIEGGDPAQFRDLACSFCYARSFFITTSGRMGIGPSDSQPGDTVAVIPGGGVPYVIRPNGSGWTLVGESYVEGIMNGEMVARYSDGTVVMEWFDLV